MKVEARWTNKIGCGLAISLATSCAANAPPADAPQGGPERTGLVAQPCAGLEIGTAPIDAGNARVFIEVAEVAERELPEPVGPWLEVNAVTVRSTANLVAFPNVPTSTPWGQCVDSVCSSTKRSITLTATLPAQSSEPIELSLTVDEAAPEGTDVTRRVLLDTKLRAVHQTPVVLPSASSVSSGSMIVTAYLLQKHDDLQRVLECKVQQGEKEEQLSR